MISSNHLNAFLAMPPSLRLAVINAPARIRPARAVPSFKRFRSSNSAEFRMVSAFDIPEFSNGQLRGLQLLEIVERCSIPSAPQIEFLKRLRRLFNRGPQFMYSESNFYNLRKNTMVPEICLLGRSNVGKSSFINAVAEQELAHVSSKPGRTKSMNFYAFSPRPYIEKTIFTKSPQEAGEPAHTHNFYLVDMPGYGYASLAEWGQQITLYLAKRTMLKGALLLIDAEVGPKETDLQALELLASAGVRTAIILTKADKVKGGPKNLRQKCVQIWEGIQWVEGLARTSKKWVYSPEIFVTALGARTPAIVSASLGGARIATARFADKVEYKSPRAAMNERWTGWNVSFTDLGFAAVNKPFGQEPSGREPASQEPSSQEPGTKTESAFAALERASAQGYGNNRGRGAGISSSTPLGASRLGNIAPPRARAFHSTAKREKPPHKSKKPNSQELRDVLDEFVEGLKFVNTTSNYAKNMRRQHDRQMPLPPEKRDSLEKLREAHAQALRRRFPAVTARTHAVREQRLSITGKKAQRRDEEIERVQKNSNADWPADPPPTRGKKGADHSNEIMTPDAFKALVTSPTGRGPELKKEMRNANNKSRKADAKQKSVLPDEFDAKFASAMSKYSR